MPNRCAGGLWSDVALDPPGFVSIRNGKFYCDERPFYFHGVTNFGLVINPAGNDSNAAVDSVFSWCNANGLRVLRCWGFYDGPSVLLRSFQNPRGVIAPAWWIGGSGTRGMDWVLKRATDYNVRVLLSFTNGWPEDFGGMKQYAQWGIDAGLFTGTATANKYRFITHTTLKQWFK